MILDQTGGSDDKLIQLSCPVIDFGEVNYVPNINFFTCSKQVQIINSSNTHKIYIKRCSSNLTQETTDFPVRVQISTIIENDNFIETIIDPNESKDLLISLISIHENSQWNERTSFFKISSSLQFQYKIIPNCESEVESINYHNINWKYKATLCTSVLFMDETELRFGSCAIGNEEPRTRTFQIWNRSESILNCCIKFIEVKIKPNTTTLTSDLAISEELVHSMIFQDYETDLLVPLEEEISIPPFASKRLQGLFQPKINVDVSENPFDILVSMEDDDAASSVDVLLDTSAPLISSSKGNQDTADNTALIFLGDTYCGNKKFNRYWLSNNSPFDIDVAFSLNFDKQFRLLLNEIQIYDNSSSLRQDSVDRAICISKYKGNGPSQNVATNSRETISRKNECKYESGLQATTSIKQGLTEINLAENKIMGNGEDVAYSQNTMADNNSNNGIRPIVNAGKNKQAKLSSIKIIDTNNNNEFDTSLTWAQLKDSGSSIKRKMPGKTLSSGGSNTLSIICGRMWGQERVLADLGSGIDVDDLNDADAIDMSSSFPNTMRPFIGEKSKAAKVSKANKKFDKLNKQLYEEKWRVEVQSSDRVVNEDSIEPSNEVIGKVFNQIDSNILLPSITEAPLRPNSSDEHSSSVNIKSISNRDTVLHRLLLKALERRLITVELCPSLHFVNEETGAVIDGRLLDRSIFVKLECNSLSLTPKQHFFRSIAFNFRACTSLISVTPSVYDMGLCNVGEYRNVSLEVKNESDLPALVFPFVESKTLEISEQKQEIRIPAHQSKQIKIGYMAKSPNSDYTENVILVNGYNVENSKEIELRAKNVDTHQILLHSLFYKLITYNDKRELQINFERCLINMPNMRVFSIKNVHSTELKLNIHWQNKNSIKLYLIALSDTNEDIDEEVIKKSIPLSRSVSFQKVSDGNEYSRRDQAIEDLKWGDNDITSSINSIQVRKAQSLRLSLGDDLINTSNPPNNMNLIESSNFKSTDTLRDSKASRSADLLSILDVTQSEINSLVPIRSNTIRALNLTEKFSNSIESHPESTFQQEKVLDNELRDGGTRFVVDDGQELINLFDKDNFPFKLLDSFDSIDSEQLKQKANVETKVKQIQKVLSELPNLFIKKNKRYYLKSLQSSSSAIDCTLATENSVEITIPFNSSHRFALVFEPQQHNENDLEECNQLDVRETIQIQLTGLTDTTERTTEDDPSFLKPNAVPQRNEPLRPRILPICAKLIRSEMVVIQKNISFGRTIVGDNTSRFVTVVNRSSIPCVYAICKSGSISSGFLKIPEGRQGFIAAFSSKYIEFIFKPTLPGTFEEILQINNVLNPRNSQSITIKAKVLKKEAFVISANPQVPVIIENYSSIEKHFEKMLNFVLNPLISGDDVSSSINEIDAKVGLFPATSSNVAASFNIGSVAVGEDSDDKLFSFRIKNVTTKSRQFIVDATHINAVVLSTHILPAFSAIADSNKLGFTPLVQEKIAFASPFEPIPEILQAVLSLRCRFESKIMNSSTDKNKKISENALSMEERKILEDSLEQFQQKLKIAIRKNKIEKIEKYQKKIDKVIDSLKDNKVVLNSNPDIYLKPPIDDLDISKAEKAENATPLTVDNNLPKVEMKSNSSTNTSSRSEVSYHFFLEPEQEKEINLKLCFLPGMSYRSWNGLLPFCGYLRIFECKNEDHVKIVRFGAMIRSTRMSINSTIPFATSSLVASQINHHDELNVDTITEEEDTEIRSWAVRMQAKQSFITTVAQWSSLSTVEVYPKYRQLPQNMLSMCIKLVQGSKDRVMHGSMSIASLMEQVGVVSLSIDEEFAANKSSEYITYNPKLHGNISFGLAAQTNIASNNSNSNLVLESSIQQDQSNEIGSLATQIGAIDSSRTSLGSKKDRIVKESNSFESESKLKGGSKIDIIIKWFPLLDLDHSKSHHSITSADATQILKSFKILGAIKVQLKIGNQVIGALQSIPFIGVLEHKSTINVPKYFTFDDVAVGSYRTCQISITNTSNTDDFHYVISSEEVAPVSRPLGKLEIISGQTGIISPNSSKQLSLLFSATAPGKFEQKLWIRNIRDSFDQKRIAIQASISVTQMKFVIFPDLEYATDSIGKFKPIDLGYIQIQSTANPELLSTLPITKNQSVYKLKILNISGKDLAVTAVSNLKNQCYIYSDESCQQLAINHLFPKEELITLYVIIRPVSIKPKSSNLMPNASITAKNSSDASSNQEINLDEGVVKAKSSLDDNGRELIGGIKLVFFSVEKLFTTENIVAAIDASTDSDKSITPQVSIEKVFPNTENDITTDVLSINSSTRKLFETALSFKAMVGKSVLTISTLANNDIQYVRIPNDLNSDVLYFISKFQLKNTSKLFSVKYSYLLDNSSEECVGKLTDELPKSFLENFDSRSGFKVKILDDTIGELQPDESRFLSYAVIYSPQTTIGVVVFPIRVINLNTFDYSCLDISTVLDSYQIQSSTHEQNNSIANISCSNVSQLIPLKCNSSICLHRRHNVVTNPIDSELTEFQTSREGKSIQLDSKETIATELYVASSDVHQSLFSWTIRNNQNKSITLFPLSDLPVIIKVEIAGCSPQQNIRRSFTNSSYDDKLFDQVTTSTSYSKKISPEILQWRKYLRRCGESFTLEPNCEMNLLLLANDGMKFEESYLKDMSGLTGNQSLQKLKAGKLVQISGVVAFLQAAHSLQTLFRAPSTLNTEPLNGSNVLDEAKNESHIVATEIKVLNNSSNSKTNNENDLCYLLPLIGLTPLHCEVAHPLLQLVEKEVCFDRSLRFGQTLNFFITVENISEVDVPCVIDHLPVWLNFDKAYKFEADVDSDVSAFKSKELVLKSSADSSEVTFIIPKKSKTRLKLIASAFSIDSKILEHLLILRTLLSTKSMNSYEYEQEIESHNSYQPRTFIDSYEVLVRLQVDATKALELIPAEDEVLFSKSVHDRWLNKVPHVINQQDQFYEENASALFIRLIKDPFIIPPPLDISFPSGLCQSTIEEVIPIIVNLKDTNQSHCRFSLKNKLSKSINVNASINLNPLMSELLDLLVTFRTNDSNLIELEAGEVSQVEIKVLPKLNSRLNYNKLEDSELYPLDGIQLPLVISDLNSQFQSSSIDESEKIKKEIFDSNLNTPTLFGTVYFTPKLKDISNNPIQNKPSNNQVGDDDDDDDNNNIETLVNDTILLDIVGWLQPGHTVAYVVPAQQNQSTISELTSSDKSTLVDDNKISTQATEVLNFRSKAVDEVELGDSFDNINLATKGSSDSVTKKKYSLSPYIRLLDKELNFYIVNPSTTESLIFFIKAKSYRHAGMKLIIDNFDDTEHLGLKDSTRMNYYDTVFPFCEPTKGSVLPATSVRITLKLVPGKVSVAIKSSLTLNTDIPDADMRNKRLMPQLENSNKALVISDTTQSITEQNISSGPYTIISMPLELWDANNLNHPPQLIFVYLTCEIALPILVTQPISETNRNKQHLDRPLIDGEKIVYSESDTIPSSTISPSDDDSNSGSLKNQITDYFLDSIEMKNLFSSLYIRLRGVTPHANIKGRYFIDLGQQILKKEALEWMLTLENCSDSTSIPYRIRPIFHEELDSWLAVGQTGGIIEAGDSRSVMLYFRRNVALGLYMTYIAIENLLEKSNIYIIAISMEIISDPKKTSTNITVPINNTILNPSDQNFINGSNSNIYDSAKSSKHLDCDILLVQQSIDSWDSENSKTISNNIKESFPIKKSQKISQRPLYSVELCSNNELFDSKNDIILLSKGSSNHQYLKISNLSDIPLNFVAALSAHSKNITLNLNNSDDEYHSNEELSAIMKKSLNEDNQNITERLLFSIRSRKYVLVAISLTSIFYETTSSFIHNYNDDNNDTIEELMLLLGCELFEDQNKTFQINISTK